eukprot:scaffold284_cov133-Skeletonema_menzelii.AAC.20
MQYSPLNSLPKNSSPRIVAHNERRHQISILSTYDADIVLRKVIEDRSNILALKRRAAESGADLEIAKARQLELKSELAQLDQEIEELFVKAKKDIQEFNTACKEYINAFSQAFYRGNIHKQPRHPSLPSTQQLEVAVSKRKATFIEKIQVDGRIRNLELAEQQNRVPEKVVKMNEQAFHQAVGIAKFQFSDSCGAWLNHVKDLLADAHSVKAKASVITDYKQAKCPPTPPSNNRQLSPHKTIIDDSRRLSLKRLSREQNEQTPETATDMTFREEKKQKKDICPIVVGYQPQFDLPSVNYEYRLPYQRDDESRNIRGSDEVQDPDSDEVSIAEVLTHLGR